MSQISLLGGLGYFKHDKINKEIWIDREGKCGCQYYDCMHIFLATQVITGLF